MAEQTSTSTEPADGQFRPSPSPLAGLGVVELACVMTLLLLMLYGSSYWFVNLPVRILCIAGLLFAPLLRNDKYWFLVALVLLAGNFFRWFEIDNHKYLIGYWCLAIYLSLRTDNPAATLAFNARLLIGLSFLFATLWKVLSPDFINGATFHYLLLTDERFTTVAELVGRLSPQAIGANRAAVAELLAPVAKVQEVALQDTAGLRLLACLMTYWTLAIEAAVAVAFLCWRPSWLSKMRDVLLLSFVVTTYLVAPVVGFGWVLIIMGAVQAEPTWKHARLCYVVAFFLLQLYLFPWRMIFDKAVGLF